MSELLLKQVLFAIIPDISISKWALESIFLFLETILGSIDCFKGSD